MSVVLLAATAFALVSADGGLEEMTLKRLRGDVSVLRAGEVIEIGDKSSIEPGDRITTGALRASPRSTGSEGRCWPHRRAMTVSPSASARSRAPPGAAGSGLTWERVPLDWGFTRAAP